MTDLIRRDDALAKIHWLSDADWTVAERRAAGEIAAAIASLPAVTVGVNESTVHRAVLDWIKNDTGAAVKMTISPDQVKSLTARILAALEPAAPDETTKNRRAYKVGVAVGKASAEARAERLEAAMVQMRDDRTGFRHAVHFRRFITAALTPTAVDDSQTANPVVNAPDPAAIRGAALREAAQCAINNQDCSPWEISDAILALAKGAADDRA